MNKILTVLILVGCSALSCKKEHTEPIESGLNQLAEASIPDGRKVILLADKEQLRVGYQAIYLRIEDASGKTDKQADVKVTPMMDMHTMQHSSPVEQPVYVASQDVYAGAVVFTMSSGEMGTWKLAVEVDGHPVDLDVTVAEAAAGNRPVSTFVGTDGTSYTIALVQPQVPKTGMNDLEVLISSRTDMHHFPPVNGLEVTFEPEMPSMGHGSPNNIDPTGNGNGRYRGKANFTMTGDWRLHFTLKRNGETIAEDVYLDIVF
ncbi:hypothetical protein GCM10011386_19880 [Parapedobacter defluvii]|uniref:YtkA-like domain-containing protein n=1 Tax=Parapedobacter defluvii TaxID=2045106 RepID=A0ABQ1LUH1_9SPHI|nr:FixH family protein [Parapedobacter defluvii]GGC27863.1 hypothetical protein GCM10011386_19880 [Parapedobacter defluvii]